MAEVMGKTSLFSPCNSSSVIGNIHHQNQHRVSMFSFKSTNFSCDMDFPSLKLSPSALRSSSLSSSDSDFYGRRVVGGGGQQWMINRGNKNQASASNSQMGNAIGKAPRWWEKGLQPNMKEVDGTQDLVESLLNAGDKLVVVDFFSPGCGGCKALHPKICQLAEMNPDVQFLQVNYEEHKSMSYTLNVHVLPFFRFYRGAQGRVCSFSCTIASIKKFKDALAKHSPDRCSLGPTKGLEEKELVALSANKELSFNYTPKPEQSEAVPADEDIPNKTLSLLLPLESTAANAVARNIKDKTLVLS